MRAHCVESWSTTCLQPGTVEDHWLSGRHSGDIAGAAASGATGTEIAAVAVFGVASWGIGGAGALVGASRISQVVVGGIYTAGGFGTNYVFTS